jgi:hypothetical protein
MSSCFSVSKIQISLVVGQMAILDISLVHEKVKIPGKILFAAPDLAKPLAAAPNLFPIAEAVLP